MKNEKNEKRWRKRKRKKKKCHVNETSEICVTNKSHSQYTSEYTKRQYLNLVSWVIDCNQNRCPGQWDGKQHI